MGEKEPGTGSQDTQAAISQLRDLEQEASLLEAHFLYVSNEGFESADLGAPFQL